MSVGLYSIFCRTLSPRQHNQHADSDFAHKAKNLLAMPDAPPGFCSKQPAVGATSRDATPAHAASSAPRPPARLQRQNEKPKEIMKAHGTHVPHHSHIVFLNRHTPALPIPPPMVWRILNSQRSFCPVASHHRCNLTFRTFHKRY